MCSVFSVYMFLTSDDEQVLMFDRANTVDIMGVDLQCVLTESPARAIILRSTKQS